MKAVISLRLAALSGLVAVAMGAFAAHALHDRLPPRLFEVFQTAVQYQFYHSLGWLAVAVLGLRTPSRLLRASALCFAAGILLFCGSLYVLALSGVHWLGAITPLGGLAFMLGWILLALAAGRVGATQSSTNTGQ